MPLDDITNVAGAQPRVAKRGKFSGRLRATGRPAVLGPAPAQPRAPLSPVKTDLIEALRERERREKEEEGVAARRAATQRRAKEVAAKAKKRRERRAKRAAAEAQPLDSPSKFRGRRRLQQFTLIAQRRYTPKPVSLFSRAYMEAWWAKHGEQLGGDLEWLAAPAAPRSPASSTASSASSSSEPPATPERERSIQPHQLYTPPPVPTPKARPRRPPPKPCHAPPTR